MFQFFPRRENSVIFFINNFCNLLSWITLNLWSFHHFQCSLFPRITTLLTWLKSTLLLKIKCFDTTIYMKTQCLQTNVPQHYCRKENAWEEGRGREMVVLIKSLITRHRKDVLEASLQKIKLKMSADTILFWQYFNITSKRIQQSF